MKKLLFLLTKTTDSLVLTILRITLGIVMFPHGAQQLLGLFGGYGFAGSTSYYSEHMGIPMTVAILIVIGQSFGSVALILGLFGRFVSFSILVMMIGAVMMVHLQNGFFMNWYGTQKGEGYEYFLLLFGIAIPLIIYGSGKYSIDKFIQDKIS